MDSRLKDRTRQRRWNVLFLPLLCFACATPFVAPLRVAQDATPASLHVFHSDRYEWLYFSGVVDTTEGRQLGVMFTVFQFVHPVTQAFIYPSILVVLDPDGKTYNAQMSSGTSGNHVVHGWPSVDTKSAHFGLAEDGSMRISGEFSDEKPMVAMDLTVTPTRPPLLHGVDGIIKMGDGLDSGYYSLTNLKPGGGVTVGAQRYTVTGGRLWMDHQWGNWTSAGLHWDWFSLRFDDGGALMLFQFRDPQNRVVPGNWTYRAADGAVKHGSAYKLETARVYKDPADGARFPLDWKIRIDDLDLTANVSPRFDAQRFKFLWEGLATVSGTLAGKPTSGHAFVELTGYSK
jgi:predicted secreted hydrolase